MPYRASKSVPRSTWNGFRSTVRHPNNPVRHVECTGKDRVHHRVWDKVEDRFKDIVEGRVEERIDGSP